MLLPFVQIKFKNMRNLPKFTQLTRESLAFRSVSFGLPGGVLSHHPICTSSLFCQEIDLVSPFQPDGSGTSCPRWSFRYPSMSPCLMGEILPHHMHFAFASGFSQRAHAFMFLTTLHKPDHPSDIKSNPTAHWIY